MSPPLTPARSRARHALPLALAFTAMFASAPGQSFLISVFVDEILAGTGLSRTAFSGLYAAATVVSATLSLSLGRSADRIGLRSSWAIVAAGLAVAAFVESFAHGVVLAAVGIALLRSFGQGSFPLLGTLVVNHWFPRRRGAAMATASFGLTTASIALPPLLALLIDGVGWRDAYRLVGVAVAVAVLPLAVLVRAPGREPAPHAAAEAPPPDAIVAPAVRRLGRTRLPVPERTAGILLLALSVPALVTTAVTFHAVSLLGERGLSSAAAAGALSVLGVASAAATLATGTVADRLPTRTLLVTFSVVLAAASALLLIDRAGTSYAAFALIGLSNGIWGVTAGIAWARAYGTSSLGRLQGLSSAAQIAAAAAGPLPLAVSLSVTHGYGAGLVFLIAVAAAGAAAATRWRDPAPIR